MRSSNHKKRNWGRLNLKSILENSNIGTIFTGEKSPNVNYYLFILNDKAINHCRQGIYCYTVSEEGMLIGKIEKITVINEYFEKPSFVKNFDNGDNYAIQNHFLFNDISK